MSTPTENPDDPKVLRAKLVKEIASSTALRNELHGSEKRCKGWESLVDTLQLKLRQTEKKADTFETLSRRLQDIQRDTQLHGSQQLQLEVQKREKVITDVHNTAKSIIEKLEVSLTENAKLEGEVGALKEREVRLLATKEALENSLAAEGKMRELQGKLLDAQGAENEAVKEDKAKLLAHLKDTMVELEEAKAFGAKFKGEVDSFSPKLAQLSDEFNKVLEQHKATSAKVRWGGRCFLFLFAPFLASCASTTRAHPPPSPYAPTHPPTHNSRTHARAHTPTSFRPSKPWRSKRGSWGKGLQSPRVPL